jgi:Electron transfer DM13
MAIRILRHEITMPEGTRKLSKKRIVWLGLAVLVLLGLWYAFRPEKLFVNKKVGEPPPASLARLTALYTGSFHSDTHEATGRATVYQQPDGRRTLTLSNFSTSNATGLHVILLDKSNLAHGQNSTLTNDRDLGELKAAQSEQSYALPADVDFNYFNTVVIYAPGPKTIVGSATLDAF